MSKIKICGIRRMEDIEAVNLYQPDFIGFVFAKSRRQIDFFKAEELKAALSQDIKSVGVFVNQDNEYIERLAKENIIDIIQLHGSEDENTIVYLKEKTGKPIIKAVSVTTADDIMKWQDSRADYLLLDNGAGGTGEKFDWSRINNAFIKHPYFIAGGINEHNIKDALQYNPYGIDVSGGVETDGYKDAHKIKNIIEKVRR